MYLKNVNNPLLKNFLDENSYNKKLLICWANYGDKDALEALNERFKQFSFRIYFYSYIRKSLLLKAREIKAKHNLLKNKEELSLNIVFEEKEEELINTIPSKSTDYEEEYEDTHTTSDFTKYVSEKKLLDAINGITKKQKQILFMYIVQDMTESEIAQSFHTSVQAINKNKNNALKKIKRILSDYQTRG